LSLFGNLNNVVYMYMFSHRKKNNVTLVLMVSLCFVRNKRSNIFLAYDTMFHCTIVMIMCAETKRFMCYISCVVLCVKWHVFLCKYFVSCVL